MSRKPGNRKGGMAAIVAEEEQTLSAVRRVLDEARPGLRATDADRDLLHLRDAFAEERLPEDRAMLMEQMDRVAAIRDARANNPEGSIDPGSPYFARLRYRLEDGEVRDILLGKATFIRNNVRVVDWRDAPISRVFYHWREGDSFDETLAGTVRSGVIEARRTMTILRGRLLRIACPQGTFLHTPDGWEDASDDAPQLSGGEGVAERPDTTQPLLGGGIEAHLSRGDKHLPEIAGLLDERQFDLISRPGAGLLVVKGGAGSGKTTVALHRIAYLNFAAPERFRPKNMMIIVFNEALAQYISRVLPALGVRKVQVRTLADWATFMRRKHLPGLTPHYSDDTPGAVLRFKTHRVMIPLLNEAVKRYPKADPVWLFDEVFTNRGWLGEAAERYAPGAFGPGELDILHGWCTDRHFWRVEGGGPNDEDYPTYDQEDDMILLRLVQLLRGPLSNSPGRRVAYDHLMVDEAQDFSPLELSVLLETVRDDSVTLAGDRAQKIIEHNDFHDWSEVLTAIDRPHVQLETLNISYRSTRRVMELATHVLGPLAPDEPVETTREGDPVCLFRCGGLGEAITFLADALVDLMEREPNASVAVLTRHPHQADEAFDALSRTDIRNLARVADQDFSFGPGIEVTDIAQTKGLEFDYVVLLYADILTYPDRDMSRHLLHVGITRAVHQLWILTWEPLSPLLPAWLEPVIVG